MLVCCTCDCTATVGSDDSEDSVRTLGTVWSRERWDIRIGRAGLGVSWTIRDEDFRSISSLETTSISSSSITKKKSYKLTKLELILTI